MAAPRLLAHPPIVEAIIDIRGAAASDLEPSRFQHLQERLAAQYPVVTQRRRFNASPMDVPQNQLDEWPTRFEGMLFKSADEKQMVQFRTDGFTLNRLRPYTDGDALLVEALRLWQCHVEVAQPAEITRISMRYINQFGLPIEAGENFSDFLTAPPVLPVELPDYMSEFLTRIVSVDEEANIVAVTTQKFEELDGSPAITIDVDVLRRGVFPVDTDGLERQLVELRAYKNKVFFALLQEATIRRFE